MFGTRRTEAFSSARGGTIVFTPGPVYPPTMPWISKVGRAQRRFMRSRGSVLRSDLNPWSFTNPATLNPDFRKSASSRRESGSTSR